MPASDARLRDKSEAQIRVVIALPRRSFLIALGLGAVAGAVGGAPSVVAYGAILYLLWCRLFVARWAAASASHG